MANLNRIKVVLVEKGKTGKWLAEEIKLNNLIMRKLLFFILSMMTCLSAFSYEVTVNVSPTTPLSECLSSEQQQTVDSIKVYGKLSEVDFNLLNRMTVSYKLIHIDLFNTTNTSIESNAFESSPLKSIVLPKNCTSIGYLSFAHCSYLESIELGNMLTSIGNGALRQCSKLKQITFPSTLSSIGTQAMDYTPFQHIYCLGETPASASANAWTCYSTCTVHVPLNCKSKYENANGWMKFENIVEETINSDDSEIPEPMVCAKPVLTYENGELHFSCDTEGATYHYNIQLSQELSGESTGVAKLPDSYTILITAYASAEGYEPSEKAITTFTISVCDVNGDGEVNIGDVTTLVNKILTLN